MKTKSRIYEKGCVITEADNAACTLRLRLPAGVLSPKQLAALNSITEQYHIEHLHLTTRQTIEIPHIQAPLLPEIADKLEDLGCSAGAERNEIVNVTACPGNDRCKFSNIDSLALAAEIDRRYFGREMPGKVRIAISACPNSCVSETLNEIGITGLRTPDRNEGYCTGCGTCVQYCREEALCVKEGRVVMDESRCLSCGTCVRSCVYGILGSYPTAYRITLGGRRGRHPKVGQHLITVSSEEAALAVVDAVIDWIYRYAAFTRPVVEQIGKELELPLLKKKLLETVPADDIAAIGSIL
ncbi:MAG: nitrite reductase [Methanocorpusculum sp.]|nr:nitrite reductase [Methanocorpusculum sp.]